MDEKFRPGNSDPAQNPDYWVDLIARCDREIKEIDHKLAQMQAEKQHKEGTKRMAQDKLDALRNQK